MLPRSASVVMALGIAVAACSPSGPSQAPGTTPAATSNDTATPTPEQTILPGLSDLIGRSRESLTQQGAFVTAIGAAPDNPALGVVATQMKSWALTEKRWLADDPPQACYKDAFDVYAFGVNDIEVSADQFAVLAEGSSPPTDAQGVTAAARLTQARAEFNNALTLANFDRGVCSKV